MTHLTEGRLLEFALDISTDNSDRAAVTQHLAVCSECRCRLEEIQDDIRVIGGIRLQQSAWKMPGRHRRHAIIYPTLRIAALIIFGAFAGFAVSNWTRSEPVYVSPAYLAPSLAACSSRGCAASDATEVPAAYYERILIGTNEKLE